jgi:NAD(P)-dependent dehydrogenase (short-subunit alcohol dehydrogenase family)
MTPDPTRLSSLFSLDGKLAVVTGGSRGIGYMIADGLIDAGCRLIISARKAEQLDTAAESLARKGRCEAIQADLSSPEGCAGLADAIAARTDSLPILVNNAGASWGEPIDTFPLGGWDKVINTNTRSVFLLTQALLPQLRAAATPDDPARVINIGSVDGLRAPSMESYSYSASKAAVHMLTRHLAKRLAPEHVTVNAIAPGPFDSKMMAFALDDPDRRAAVAAEVPLGRIGRPDDMAAAVIYLASRAGAYLTGAVVPVSGGIACAD